ncbi:hypothetical protein SENBN9181_41250 [Salmonella enterica subsp. enterica serovar Typhimurium]|nr:hypothetical protein [Salmonella sp.]CAH2850313.1 hypothetical protein SENBN9181_41250 [Salmonella enterica subsp. enterica serovar Typhimurium]
MMAGGEGACQPARKNLQAGACGGKDRGRASRRSLPFSPSASDGVHLQPVSISVGGCDVRTESGGNN